MLRSATVQEQGPVGLIIVTDEAIPGYSSILICPAVPAACWPLDAPPAEEPAPPPRRRLLVVTAHHGRYMTYVRARRRKFGQDTRLIKSADELIGVDDAEIAFLGDWHRLDESEEIRLAAREAEALRSVTITIEDPFVGPHQ